MKDNLRALYNDATPADRKLWAGWYEGAHKVAERAARRYGIDLASAAGVYAALSPQAQWDRNVYLGDRLIDIVKTKHAEKWDDGMTRSVDAWVTSRSGRAKTEGMRANSEAQTASGESPGGSSSRPAPQRISPASGHTRLSPRAQTNFVVTQEGDRHGA